MLRGVLGLTAQGQPGLVPYRLSSSTPADIMVIDVSAPVTVPGLSRYREIHAGQPLLLAVGNADPPLPAQLHLGRPLTATAMHAALLHLAGQCASTPGAPETVEFPDARVLLAETDQARVGQLHTALAGLVGTAEVALGGADADRAIARGGWNVVVLDSALQGPDAYSLCRQARSIDAAVVMLLAADDTGARSHARDAGCDTYLIRPVNERILHEVIAEYLDEF